MRAHLLILPALLSMQVPSGCVPEGMSLVEQKDMDITEANINEHFVDDVAPHLASCFEGLAATGAIATVHDYKRDDEGYWVADGLLMEASTFEGPLADRVLGCMRNAANGTRFGPDAGDHGITSLTLHWTWPVPLPDDWNDPRPLMGGSGFGSSSSVCPRGKAPKCWKCNKQKSHYQTCDKVCAGFKYCSTTKGWGKRTYCSTTDACITSTIFGATDQGILHQ